MDGENKGKPYEQMDDLGGFPIFLETPKRLHLPLSGFRKRPAWKRLLMKSIAAVEPATCTRT